MIKKVKANIKPLSMNRAYQGRKFKTVEYKEYEAHLLETLPNRKIPNDKFLEVEILLNLTKTSYSRFDVDNAVKPILDILQKRYNFNDSKILKLKVEKVLTVDYSFEVKIKVLK